MSAQISWAVLHPVSRRFDGWYAEQEMAIDVLRLFRQEWPHEQFRLVAWHEMPIPCTDENSLLWMEWGQWTFTPPRLIDPDIKRFFAERDRK